MAHWDSTKQKIIECKIKKSKQWPKWDEVDCGCCGGICWGGEYPREGKDCDGRGFIFVHRKTGTRARWPGGPFC